MESDISLFFVLLITAIVSFMGGTLFGMIIDYLARK